MINWKKNWTTVSDLLWYWHISRSLWSPGNWWYCFQQTISVVNNGQLSWRILKYEYNYLSRVFEWNPVIVVWCSISICNTFSNCSVDFLIRCLLKDNIYCPSALINFSEFLLHDSSYKVAIFSFYLRTKSMIIQLTRRPLS